MIVIQKIIVPKWTIAGHENYVFGDDKRLYNTQRGKEVKPILKRYTVGYNIKGKFISQKKLKPLLVRYVQNECPF